MTQEEKKAYKKAWYEANRERMLDKMKARYQDKKEEYAAASKEYVDAHKEEIAAYKRAWYLETKEENKEERNRKSRAWNASHKEKRKEAMERYLKKLNLANAHISRRTLAAWATQVKQLNPRCDWCLTVDDLEAHHILPKAHYPELALDVSNGQTLCKRHHIETHIIDIID